MVAIVHVEEDLDGASQKRTCATPHSLLSLSPSPSASSSSAARTAAAAAAAAGPTPSPSNMNDLLPSSDDEQTGDVPEAGPSRSPSPSPARPPSASRRKSSPAKRAKGPTQLATHLPIATGEALETFESLKVNFHQNNKVGKSKGRERDVMVCECQYRHGE